MKAYHLHTHGVSEPVNVDILGPQRTMQARQDLDRLQSLQVSDNSRHDTQHAHTLTRPRRLWCRRLREEAPVTWPSLSLLLALQGQVVRAKLAFPLERGTTDQWFAQPNGGVGQQIADREVVGAVENEVVRCKKLERVRGRERSSDRIDLHARIKADASSACHRVQE